MSAVQIVIEAYQLARDAEQGVGMADVGQALLEELRGVIREAQDIWYDTPISRYLDCLDPVCLDEQGVGPVRGSCWHDLALGVAVGLLDEIEGNRLAADYVRRMRYNTAAGDEVAQNLASLITRVRCESAGIARHASETTDQGAPHANAGDASASVVTPKAEVIDPPPDPFAALRDFARHTLKGKQRAVVESLCDSNGECLITSLAIQEGIDWGDPMEGFKSAKSELNKKLKSRGWKLRQHALAAVLVKIPERNRGGKGGENPPILYPISPLPF